MVGRWVWLDGVVSPQLHPKSETEPGWERGLCGKVVPGYLGLSKAPKIRLRCRCPPCHYRDYRDPDALTPAAAFPPVPGEAGPLMQPINITPRLEKSQIK